MPYDPATGLVFTETVISADKSCRYCYELFSTTCTASSLAASHPGITLEDTAIRLLLQHLHALTTESLKELPEKLQKKLWHAALRSTTIPLSIWKQFVLASSSLTYRSRHLFIPCDCLSAPTLLQALKDVTSQLSLQLKISTAPLEDRIVRAWIQRPEGPGLASLNTLVLVDQGELTTHSLKALGQLPKLRLIVALRCGFSSKHLRAKSQREWRLIKPDLLKVPFGTILELEAALAHEHAVPDNRLRHDSEATGNQIPSIRVLVGRPGFSGDDVATKMIVLQRRYNENDPTPTMKREHSATSPQPQPAQNKRNARLKADLQAMVTSI